MEAPTSLDVPVLPARGPEDLLAYVGHALGRLPEGSLVLLTLRDGRLRAVVRVDLPPEEVDVGAWACAVAEVCRRDAAADATLCLALPDGARATLARPGWAAALDDALASAGRPLTAAWTCARGRARPWWGSGVAEEGPLDPRAAPLSLHLMTRGSVWDRAAVSDPVPRRGPAAARPDDARWRPPEQDAPPARRAWLAQWEPVLTGTARGRGAPAPAVLGSPLTRPAWRDGLLLHAAAPSGAATGDPGDEERILTAASGRAPAWDRLDALRAGLRALVPVATPAVAAQALALAGWVGWARGHGSDADAHLTAAAALSPGDPFVSVLRRIVAAGCVAGWATDPATAWRPDGGRP